jgi:hypothetical protein
MKRSFPIAFAIFTILCILAKDITAVSWEIWYVSNKAYVAKELCVNKKKPQMRCNGKCHLAKQLQQLEEQEKPEKSSVPVNLKLKAVDWIAVKATIAIIEEQLFLERTETVGWPEDNRRLVSIGKGVFRPPVV